MALAWVLLFSVPGFARVQRDVLRTRRGGGETKVAAQWTLSDFLNDQNQASLLNSVLTYDRNADWYEINVRARAGQTRRAGRPTTEQRAVDLDAYLLIFNLHGEFERTSTTREATGLGLGARVIGTSTRTTNLVVRYGWRRQRDDERASDSFERRFVEAEAQLYLLHGLGLEGGYRHYEPKGARVEGGVFVELQPVRLSVGYQREDVGGVVREVWNGGVKAFF